MRKARDFIHEHPGGFFVAVELFALAVLFIGSAVLHWDSVAVILGGALGAWLNMLDVLSDHKVLKVKKAGMGSVTWNEVLYLFGRTILGGMSGFVAFNVWGGSEWFVPTAPLAGHTTPPPIPYAHLLSLGILAGFSTTTLAKLSKASIVRSDDHDEAVRDPKNHEPHNGGTVDDNHRNANPPLATAEQQN